VTDPPQAEKTQAMTTQATGTKDYGSYSFWLEHSGDDLTPRPPLDGSTEVDVAILGAGFTGLWTAYSLLRRDPSLNVLVVEREIAGFGASGRNGGWCVAEFPLGPRLLSQRYGRLAARAVNLAMIDSLDDIERVTREEGIDAHFSRGGALSIARADYDLPKLEAAWEEYVAIGLEDRVALLNAAETAERIRVKDAVGAFVMKEGARVQPARLARGLARAVERRGGRIVEGTMVLDYEGGVPPRLITDRGDVRARRAIVLAGEAYLSRLPKLRRHVVPMTSHIVATEPLPPRIWEEIGWAGNEVAVGFGSTAGYLNHTADGRITFGAYRSRYPYLSRISDDLDHMEDVFTHARHAARVWFPALQDVQFTHAWGGVFGAPRDRMPTMGYNRRTGVALAFGYTGEGVCTANLSGRVLTDLLTDTESELTTLPVTTHQPVRWEPEPLRSLGINLVRRARYQENAEVERTGRYPQRPSLAKRLFEW
jgi:glycine/D-amino acid oxidase-like deaminating enzyme